MRRQRNLLHRFVIFSLNAGSRMAIQRQNLISEVVLRKYHKNHKRPSHCRSAFFPKRKWRTVQKGVEWKARST